jgi:methylenetetrahydrofolate dehydrogenase (NADP+) / methenyltetrahydrofolate cyclohydrolase
MTAVRMDGKAIAAKVREEVAAEVEELGDVGLTTVLVGDDPASDVYIRAKHKAATSVGIHANDIRLPADIPQEELLELLAQLNADDDVDGILVQLPLPSHLDEAQAIEAIDPSKDVDGFHPENAGLLYLGRPRLVPGTPLGVMRLLAEYEIPLQGAHAVVVGRSAIVGKPTAQLLLQANATVTTCHSRTVDLQKHTLDADVLVAAAGHLHLIDADMVKMGATVIDVGMHRTEEGLFGDVDPGAFQRAGHMTPVPGGVGPMTVAMLLKNSLTAARLRRGLVSPAT